MGYLTKFSLSWKGELADNPKIQAIANDLSLPGEVRLAAARFNGNVIPIKLDEIANENISVYLDGNSAIKWYDHSQDMIKLSKEFPNLLFILEGAGEESEDIWRKYYRNGKEQVAKAQIIFEECKI